MKIMDYGGKNHHILFGREFSALQSYESLVAVKYQGRLYLGDRHDYSPTTGRYMRSFSGGLSAAERRKALDCGNALPLSALPNELKDLLDIR